MTSVASQSGAALRLAVVGHANTGKTSLLQTLLRRRDFGVVSPRGGTTRVVDAGDVRDASGVIATILDTPGLEDSLRLRDAIDAGRTDRHEDPRTLLDRFLESPAARDDDDLGLEAASIRAALDATILLYAIDAREDPKPRHLDELAVLAATARPVVPVLNFTARPDADAGRWRDACARQGLHATVSFDAVVYDDAGERRLLEAVRTLAPAHDAAITRWLDLRARERGVAVATACEVAADLLVDAAAAIVVTATATDDAGRRAAFSAASETLLSAVRRREADARDDIAAAFGFSGDDARATTLEVAEALGGVDFASPESLERAGLWAAGAGAGLVAAGAMIDLAVGGMSLGGFTALGAVGAALGAAGASGRKVLRRLRGQDEVRLGDAAVEVLAVRAMATIRAFLSRGHAAIEPVSIESAVASALEVAGEGGRGEAERIDAEVRGAIRAARGRGGWSSLSVPAGSGVVGPGVGPGRAEAVATLAARVATRVATRVRTGTGAGAGKARG